MIYDLRLMMVVLLSASGLGQVAYAETLLRWKFVEGDAWQITVDQHTTTATTGAGKPTGIDITMQLQLSWAVDSVDSEGTAQITQQIERFSVTMRAGAAEPVEYASDSETKPSGSAADIAAAVEPVIGANFVVTMSNRGAIREVKLSDAAAEAFAAIDSPALKQLFSPEGISRLLAQSAVELPEAAISVDGSWTQSSKIPSTLGTLKQDRAYTLVGQEETEGKMLERIEITGELVVEPSEQAPGSSKLVDQDLTGELLFDAGAGRLVSSQSKQKFVTERPYREFKIRVETTAETKTTLSPR
ncbi:MAG TPA: DUF6263 family protein [Pirellulaceae bacterium]|nr:DUF6263 family protein [Pirellulaceae bacterium]